MEDNRIPLGNASRLGYVFKEIVEVGGVEAAYGRSGEEQVGNC
jgi:hypothetical protein